MRLRDCNIVLRRIGTDHVGAQSRQRLRQDSAAAADIEHAETLQAVELFRIAAKMRSRLIADIAQPDRIELVQGGHRPARIPPVGRMAREPLDLGLIDAGYAGFSGNH